MYYKCVMRYTCNIKTYYRRNIMPLQSGQIASGESFTGREALLVRIEKYIDMSQSVVLIAPRRYGKSSIIQKVLETKRNYKSIEIDIMKIYNKRDLANTIIQETYKLVGVNNILEYVKKKAIDAFTALSKILESLSFTMSDIGLDVTIKLASEQDDDALLKHALELPQKIAALIGTPIIFAIDELGEIKELKEHDKILALMRSIFQKSSDVRFIFAGSQYSLMNEIFTDKNSPFFRFAEPVNVPVMKAKEFKGFFENAFRKDELSLYESFTEDLVKISGGIPYYIIKIAQETLITAVINRKMNTYPIHVCKAALKQYKKEETYFLGELAKLKGKKHHIQLLKALSRNEDPYKEMESIGVVRQNARKILKSLEDDGIIIQANGYNIIDPFMKRFIRREL